MSRRSKVDEMEVEDAKKRPDPDGKVHGSDVDGKAVKKAKDVVYLLVGINHAGREKTIIGQQTTRHRAWKQWEMIRDMASMMYSEVAVVKGKMLPVDSLFRNIKRTRKPTA